MSTNVLILAAGRAQAPDAAPGKSYPLCLTELDGRSLIEKIYLNTRAIEAPCYYVAVLASDVRRFHLDKVVQQLIPGVTIVVIPENTAGAACTALLAAVRMEAEAPLLIVGANELVDLDLALVLADFQARGLDGGAVTFRSLHPRYSYVKLDADQRVVECTAQEPISQHATSGIFWYARTADYVEGAKALIRKDASVDGTFFVAPVFNELILQLRSIGVYPIPATRYIPLKTEQQVWRYEAGANP